MTATAARSSTRRMAVFDLDGTLSWDDTLRAYLVYALKHRPVRLARLWDTPWLALRFALTRDRGALKSALVQRVLGGLSRETIATITLNFLSTHWELLMRADAINALRRHRADGDYVVLMSASTDCYVSRIGERLEVNEVICTTLRWEADILHGGLTSPNCHGPEKTRHLNRLRREHPGVHITAYGNAASDIEHLVAADEGMLTNGSPSAQRQAIAQGLRCIEWR